MEINVWLSYAQTVISALSRFVSSSNPKNQSNGGELRNAPESVVPSTSISMNVTSQGLTIKRNPNLTTVDALFGAMAYEGRYIGVTMERTAVAIPVGTYRGYKRDSAHFAMKVVGIDVPSRTNIECHPANLPSQLLGCIAIGESKDGDALDNSRTAFDAMMAAVPDEFSVSVTSS